MAKGIPKNIQNKPRINEDPKDALLREYQDEVSKLKEQLMLIQQGMDPSELMKKAQKRKASQA